MPSNNRIILASAGSGKTTAIIKEAHAFGGRCALITYTIDNTLEIVDKTYELIGFVPVNLTVSTWYTFLLRHFVRPYQNSLYSLCRISEMAFVNQISAKGIGARDIGRYYFSGPGRIYSDKVTDFACKVIEKTGGMPIRRLAQIFERIYVDESQDLAGYDLDLIELLMKWGVTTVLVGDPRQAVYSTHSARRNKQYAGPNIVRKFEEWQRAKLCTMESQHISNRCTQAICDFADTLFPNLPKTVSQNRTMTGHDGAFAVEQSQIPAYMEAFKPQTLRYSRATKNVPGHPINFRKAKGLTFERCLIFPHKALEKFILTGNLADAGKSLSSIYVACTRARQSTAFVIPNEKRPATIPLFQT
jgi:DNA helicase-2/ATP-dependent DNA helicase PcrA